MIERKTENLVRDTFRKLKYYDDNAIIVEEQKSDNPRINKLLKNASKKGNGAGYPEFIVTFDDTKDLLIVVECKADIKKHESKNRDKFTEYAVDGVLLYSSYLSKEFNVIAIAVSGQNEEELLVSNFLQLSGIDSYNELESRNILSFEDYIRIFKENPEKEKKDVSTLMKYSIKLHNDLRDFAKLSEPEKPLLVSAILIALSDESFRASYSKKKKPVDLANLIISTIKEVLEHAKLPNLKIEKMLQPYSFITVHPELTKDRNKNEKSNPILYDLVKDIDEKIRPFASEYYHYDILGQFYGEFLRYTGGDKKGLGIVLTPRHITELFADLADVKKDDVVLDNCCGTTGFLISAMKKMIGDAKGDSQKIKEIKEHQLIGIEQSPTMFALGCANMILRGDGKANMYQDSCFSLLDIIKNNHKCTVAFLNPPYSQKGEGLSELDFVYNCLDCLEKNGICIAIVPMSCAIGDDALKQKLSEKHSLEAVMSMPDDLFHPSGVVPCIMVFRAGKAHNPLVKTWFGYWKDDGFEKAKHLGRIDKKGRWLEIKKIWVEMFMNRKEIAGYSVLKEVTASDEWCAEAYMETDYSKLSKNDFLKSIKEYVLFNELFLKND